ncbi:MAG TPA: Ig-like domain-containing protein [Armatimonadota bacterium]|jgi:hypothetical protein
MRKRLLTWVIILAVCVCACIKILPLHAQDGPTFEIQVPYAGQTLEGPKMPISATFRNSDTVPIVRFDVALDGTRFFGGAFRKPTPAGSFEITEQCDITKAKPTVGSHTLTIRLTDAQGRVAERSLIIYYQPPTTRPTEHNAPKVRIVSPASGTTIAGKTDIRVEAWDDTALKFVKIFIDGLPSGMTNKESFQFTWDPIEDKLASGSHTITATAEDIYDNKTESEPVLVLVNNAWVGQTAMKPSPKATVETATSPIGILQVATTAPTMRQTGATLPLATLASPSWTAGLGTTVPNLFANLPRAFAAPTAPAGTLDMTPARSLPEIGMSATTPMWGAKPDVFALQQTGSASVMAPRQLASVPVARQTLTTGPGFVVNVPDAASTNWLVPGHVDTARSSVYTAPTSTQVSPSLSKSQPTSAILALTHVASPAVAATTAPATLNPSSQSAAARSSSPWAVDLIGPNGERVPVLLTPMSTRQAPDAPLLLLATPVIEKSQPAGLLSAPRWPQTNAPLGGTALSALQPSNLFRERLNTPTISMDGLGSSMMSTMLGRQTVGEMPLVTFTAPALGKIAPSGSIAAMPNPSQLARIPVPPVVTVRGTNGAAMDVAVTPLPASRVMKSTPAVGAPLPTLVSQPATSMKPDQTATPATSPAPAPAGHNPLLGLQRTYTVQPGDTLSKISRECAVSVGAILRLNPSLTAEHFVAGTSILLPRRAASLTMDNAAVPAAGPVPYVTGDGYTMVAMRSLVQVKGGVLVWLPKTREVNAWVNNNYMGVTIGKRVARINAETYVMPAPARLCKSRTMVPLVYLMKGMNLELNFDPATNTYALTSQPAK